MQILSFTVCQTSNCECTTANTIEIKQQTVRYQFINVYKLITYWVQLNVIS